MVGSRARWWKWVAVATWMMAIAAGFGSLRWHEFTPGPAGASPNAMPPGSSLRLAKTGATVVMAVHPRCPCTRASLDVLAAILKASPRGATVHLLVYRPQDGEDSWGEVALPVAIPGAIATDDPGGAEAARLGLATSGAVVVFGPDGRKWFEGGLTASRGSPTRSGGAVALRAILSGHSPAITSALVFGCSLESASASDPTRRAAR